MNELDQLVENLDKLDKSEQRRIYDRLSYQMSKRPDFTQAEQDVWDAAQAVSGEYRSLTSLFDAKKYTRAAYSRKVEFVVARLQSGCRQPLLRQQHVALLHCALQCLGKWVKANGKPVLLSVIIDHLDDLPEALDLAFPGYASARMLDLLVRFASDQPVLLHSPPPAAQQGIARQRL